MQPWSQLSESHPTCSHILGSAHWYVVKAHEQQDIKRVVYQSLC